MSMYTIQKTDQFEKWFRKLKDIRAKARILVRIKKAEMGNLGDHRPVGQKISEMKIDYGPGYRLYFTKKKDVIILLLTGGDKSSQSRDIEKAQKILVEIGEQYD